METYAEGDEQQKGPHLDGKILSRVTLEGSKVFMGLCDEIGLKTDDSKTLGKGTYRPHKRTAKVSCLTKGGLPPYDEWGFSST